MERSIEHPSEIQAYIWPNPTDIPLYVSIKRAAEIAGVSSELMRQWVTSKYNPIPHIVVGRGGKILVRTAAIPEYMKSKEA